MSKLWGKGKSSSGFEAQIVRTGGSEPVLEIQVMGPLKNEGEMVSYSVFLEDRSGGSKKPFLWMQGGKLGMVESLTLTTQFSQVGAKFAHDDWFTIFSLPVSKMQFARKGIRRLNCNVIVNGGGVSATALFDFNQVEAGFDDVSDAKHALYSSVFCLISGFRSENPVRGNSAVNFAADWVLEESATWSQGEKEDVFARFRRIAESVPPVVGWREACGKYCEPLRKGANAGFRNSIIRLFYNILVGDRELKEADEELRIFYDVCVAIGVDMESFSRLSDRLVLVCNLSDHDPDVLLGLHSNMNDEELKKRLRDEYKKWNDRVTHSDNLIKSKAIDMMKIISNRRSDFSI